jgi:tRNA pseudouridine38-40 synthase
LGRSLRSKCSSSGWAPNFPSAPESARRWSCCNIVRYRNLKLTLAYDGSDFSGFAPQPGRRTVTAELEKALLRLLKKHIKITGASRTDAGVHALGQVISFKSKIQIPMSKLPLVLNNILPEDIRILKAQVVGKKFNARFSAKSKEYEYLIFNGRDLPVHLRNQVWQIKPKLDIAAMRKEAKVLVGRHDFSSFCASGSDDKNKVRTIHKISIKRKYLSVMGGKRLSVIAVRVIGKGFLYKMVRNMVGTLVYAGLGKIKDVKPVLEFRDRRRAGKTAPPQGLYLIRVSY